MRTATLLSPSSTLLELLEERAALLSDAPLFHFVEDSDDEQSTLPYSGLLQRARSIGACLQQFTSPGERAVLLYPPGLDYVAGFFGCLYAGVVAVPAYPPDPMRLERTLPRLRAIIQDAQATVVLTTVLHPRHGGVPLRAGAGLEGAALGGHRRRCPRARRRAGSGRS